VAEVRGRVRRGEPEEDKTLRVKLRANDMADRRGGREKPRSKRELGRNAGAGWLPTVEKPKLHMLPRVAITRLAATRSTTLLARNSRPILTTSPHQAQPTCISLFSSTSSRRSFLSPARLIPPAHSDLSDNRPRNSYYPYFLPHGSSNRRSSASPRQGYHRSPEWRVGGG